MFPSKEADLLAKYLSQHYSEKACDWLYPDFVKAQPTPCMTPPVSKNSSHAQPVCSESLKRLLLYQNQTALCRHMGHVSSLPGKMWYEKLPTEWLARITLLQNNHDFLEVMICYCPSHCGSRTCFSPFAFLSYFSIMERDIPVRVLTRIPRKVQNVRKYCITVHTKY